MHADDEDEKAPLNEAPLSDAQITEDDLNVHERVVPVLPPMRVGSTVQAAPGHLKAPLRPPLRPPPFAVASVPHTPQTASLQPPPVRPQLVLPRLASVQFKAPMRPPVRTNFKTAVAPLHPSAQAKQAAPAPEAPSVTPLPKSFQRTTLILAAERPPSSVQRTAPNAAARSTLPNVSPGSKPVRSFEVDFEL